MFTSQELNPVIMSFILTKDQETWTSDVWRITHISVFYCDFMEHLESAIVASIPTSTEVKLLTYTKSLEFMSPPDKLNFHLDEHQSIRGLNSGSFIGEMYFLIASWWATGIYSMTVQYMVDEAGSFWITWSMGGKSHSLYLTVMHNNNGTWKTFKEL